LQLDAHRLTGEALELRQRPQSPIEARRGHLQHVAARQRILDVEECTELRAHAFAVGERHAARLAVYVDPQEPLPPKVRIEIRERVAERTQRRLEQHDQLLLDSRSAHRTGPAHKNGPPTPISVVGDLLWLHAAKLDETKSPVTPGP